MRHEVIHTSSGSTMLQAAGTGLRFSVRRLQAFDDPAALALAAACGDARAAQRLRALQAGWREAREQPAAWRATPHPLLILDEDATPVLLLPLLLWRAATRGKRTAPTGILTLAGLREGAGCAPVLPRPERLKFTALQWRALWRTVQMKLALAEADLLICQPLPPTGPLTTAELRRLLRRDALRPCTPLPCRRAVHPLSWRGWLALLQARLAP